LDASVRVGRLSYGDGKVLVDLRSQLGSAYVVRRRGEQVEIAAVDPNSPIPGELTESRAGDVTDLLAWRLSEWLVEHFSATGRQLFRRRRSLVVVSNRAEDNLLHSVMPRNVSLPDGIAFQAAFELEVRVERPGGRAEVFVALDSRTRPKLDASVSDLVAAGVSVEGLYVRRPEAENDAMLSDAGRLTGRVDRIQGHDLILADHDDGWPTIPAREARLEPRSRGLDSASQFGCGDHSGGGPGPGTRA
jgi:hypothetical protein